MVLVLVEAHFTLLRFVICGYCVLKRHQTGHYYALENLSRHRVSPLPVRWPLALGAVSGDGMYAHDRN